MSEQEAAKVKQISVQSAHDLKQKAENPSNGQALHHFDVRRLEELQTDGYIAGSNHIPLADLCAHHLPEDKAHSLIFSCAAGGRSMTAAQKAIDWGYKNVYSVDGGFRGWRDAQLPIVNASAQQFKGQPIVRCFYDKPTGTCQFVVYDSVSKKAAIIDPVLDFDNIECRCSFANADRLLEYVNELKLDIEWILETHAHADHLSSSQYLKAKFGGKPKVAIGAGIPQVQKTFATLFNMNDLECDGRDFDYLFQDSESLTLGSLPFKIFRVSGHTPDHLCYYIGDSVFVGDSIFMPDSGSARCDFPGGSAKQLFHSIRDVLFSLPDSTRVFVGHDYMPNQRNLIYQTTIGAEKLYNTHAKLEISEEDFIKLRETRDKTLGNPRLLFQSLQVNIRAGKLPKTHSSPLFPDRILFTIPVIVPSGSEILTK